MKIVVTGGAGFIGSNLTHALVKLGHEVTVIDDLSYGQRKYVPAGVAFREWDITRGFIRGHLEGVDVVFHLAALCDIPYCDRNPLWTIDTNVMGTAMLFHEAVKAGVKKVIFAETAAIYEGTNIRPTPESEFCPQYVYGVSKACCHLLARAWRNACGLSTVGMRFLGAYGPRQDWRRKNPAIMSNVMLKLLRGERPILYDGDDQKFRDFIYVDDVVDFLILAMNDPRTDGETYNVGSSRSYSIQRVVEEITEISGTGRLPNLFPAPPTGPQSLQSVLADTAKARALGWEPKVGLHEGLTRMWEFMKQDVAEGI
jgi:UDP-glucose 4-epimerase